MHDNVGRPLAVGDKVLIPATVVETQDPTSDACNIRVRTEHPMAGRTEGDMITLNAKQVLKAETQTLSASCVIGEDGQMASQTDSNGVTTQAGGEAGPPKADGA